MPPAPPAPLVPPRPFILNEVTWKTVRDARYEVAVLPWGATEAHNLHLPYTTDNIETKRIAALAAGHAWERGARVVVLPLVPFGVNTGQLDIPLCLNLNPSTQALVLRDLATALAGQGVPKLVILNGHGGDDFRQMIRELQPAGALVLCPVNWYQGGGPKAVFADLGGHAGELETSAMLHLAPGPGGPPSAGTPGPSAPTSLVLHDVPRHPALPVEAPQRNVDAEGVHAERPRPVVAHSHGVRHGRVNQDATLHQPARGVELRPVAGVAAEARAEAQRL